MNNTPFNRALYIIPITLSLSSCVSKELSIKPAGFWQGFVHGLVSPFAIIAKYIAKLNYAVYAEYNTGMGYLIGFMLGLVFLLIIILIIRLSIKSD